MGPILEYGSSPPLEEIIRLGLLYLLIGNNIPQLICTEVGARYSS